MIKIFTKNDVHPWRQVLEWQKEHPYTSSFLIAFLFTCYMLFSSPALELVERSDSEYNPLSFVDVELMQQKELNAAKEVDVDPNAAPDANNVERATGITDWKTAIDSDYVSNAAPPRPVGRLKNDFPKSAEDEGIEAIVFLDLLIHTNGKVVNIVINKIKLLKEVPAARENKLRKDFALFAKKNLMGQQFTPFIVNGEKKRAKVFFRYRFKLPN